METDNTPKPQEHQEQLPNPAPVAPPVSIPAPRPQIQQPAVLEFATKEQAEAAFIDLLRKTVSSNYQLYLCISLALTHHGSQIGCEI